MLFLWITQGKSLDSGLNDGKRSSSSGKEKHSKKKKSSRYIGSGSDDDDLVKIKKGSRKKWYSSDEYSSSSSDDSEPSKRNYNKKEKKNRRKKYSSEDHSLSDDTRNQDSYRDSDNGGKKNHKRGRNNKTKKSGELESNVSGNEIEDRKTARTQMGLEWMLRPAENKDENPSMGAVNLPFEASKEEVCNFHYIYIHKFSTAIITISFHWISSYLSAIFFPKKSFLACTFNFNES